VRMPWRWRDEASDLTHGDNYGGDPTLLHRAGSRRRRPHRPASDRRVAPAADRPPSLLRRMGASLAETRKRVLPLPDEVIDQYLGNGERMIHNDHPSFRSFMVQNTLLMVGMLVVAGLFLGVTFNGPLLGAAFLLLILSVVLLVLVLKRLGDRYTSYVVTDTRIMRISGIISRRAHSIPWVRVTDLTIEQSLAGRFLGYATLHIESANEDSGLRDLEGVSDPLQFNQYVVDMVVAKQGATEPIWQQRGEPAPSASERGLRRIRSSRRRRISERRAGRAGAEGPAWSPDGDTDAEAYTGAATEGGADRAAGAPGSRRRVATAADGRRRQGPSAGGKPPEEMDDEEIEALDAETLARNLRAPGEPDLPWRR
jgi:membrane protein YdbS with pleckstrin-like domain